MFLLYYPCPNTWPGYINIILCSLGNYSRHTFLVLLLIFSTICGQFGCFLVLIQIFLNNSVVHGKWMLSLVKSWMAIVLGETSPSKTTMWNLRKFKGLLSPILYLFIFFGFFLLVPSNLHAYENSEELWEFNVIQSCNKSHICSSVLHSCIN